MADCGGWRPGGGAEVHLRGSISLVVCTTGLGSVEGVRPIRLLCVWTESQTLPA